VAGKVSEVNRDGDEVAAGIKREVIFALFPSLVSSDIETSGYMAEGRIQVCWDRVNSAGVLVLP
jgi:hypothetical protein